MRIEPVVQRLNRFLKANPDIADDVYLAPNATVLGATTVGRSSSIWFQCVIRADINKITIGHSTNIQDGSILHVADKFPLVIGDYVSCGHRAVVHACTIEDRTLIGMGAIILDGAIIGAGSIVGASALVTKGAVVPPGSLVLGAPAKVMRSITPDEASGILQLAQKYVAVAKFYRERGTASSASSAGSAS
jgi:carbonic anhydrase/acetyltransferase-like protein (isoleucine patch superfamily)